MKRNLATSSWLLFGLSLVLWLALTVFEPTLEGMSQPMQRLIIFLMLVLPSGIGAVLGLMSLLRKERRTWIAIVSTLLNTMFALFHLVVILFAG